MYDTEQESFSQYKSLTTPDTADCAASCLQKAAEGHGLTLQEFLAKVDLFCFGSTHALNTVLTDRGSRVGILTTKGHRDSYFIAEMDRGGYHDIREASERTFVPLVERELVAEVSERIDFAGRVVVPLYEDEVRAKITALVEAGMEALVIGFLWSHRYPQHELRVAEIAREMYPELHVTAGSEITGTLGEFTRLTTAVINGYIGQRVEQQAASLEKFLRENGLAV
ncbi:MAG: hydantoinase/oxoprolinase N-terminal domain-containing protein, partial [Solirubrobacterales bacterium]